MLVICEDCAKKYNIDESRIKGRRARFTCNECGHIIIIDKADISRPLVQKQDEELSTSPTIDLLREMEAPFGLDSESKQDHSDESSDNATTEEEQQAAEKKASAGTSISGYFLIGSILTFMIISAGIGYIYMTVLANILAQQVDVKTDLIVQSVIILGGGWLLVFMIMLLIARYVSKSLVKLTEDANRIVLGERDREIQPRGPKETKEIALVIQKLIK